MGSGAFNETKGDLLERTIDGVTDLFIVVDHDWKFLFLNSAAKDWFRTTLSIDASHVIDRDLWDVAPHLVGTRFETECRAAARDLRPRTFQSFLESRNAWYDVRVYPTSETITLQVRAVTRESELEEVMASRARLMRGFTHDLKNPIGAADGHAALLGDGVLGPLAPQQANSVARIRAALKSAVELIDHLMELERAESGQIQIRTVALDVREVAREMVAQYRPAAEQEGLAITGSLETVDLVPADADRVRQILGNLLSNAVKYTPRGGSVEVRTRMSRSDNRFGGRECAAIDVADTGIGIPDDKLDVLFREFERIDPSVRPGVGLGLAISRRIARLMGGDITVETQRGKGSVFTLWLPAAAD